MTVYNGGRYLPVSARSILNQTYRDFEFLVIDDSSTDDSVQIIEAFADERIRLYRNQGNLGQTRSLNIGLRMAAGEYVARMDADDMAFPFWLEKQLTFIVNNPECSVVSAYVAVIDEENKIKKNYKPPVNHEDIILRSLIASPINHVGCVFKKKDILDQGGYDEGYKTAADYDLWGKLLRNNRRVVTNPQLLMVIREHARSLSRSERGKLELLEIMDIVRKNVSHFTTAGLTENEIGLFCKANYDEGNLTASEFTDAIEITKRVYRNLDTFLEFKNSKMDRWTHRRCMTLYLKRFFSSIRKRDYLAARGISWEGVRVFGPMGVFMAFFIFSLFGKMFLRHLPGFYEGILRKKARFFLTLKN